MLNIWTESSGYDFDAVEENTDVTYSLPISYNSTATSENTTFSIISGHLPTGISLVGDLIKGVPSEVATTIEYKFVVRASAVFDEEVHIEDRTFTMSVNGPDTPLWITPTGIITFDSTNRTYVIANTAVELQLLATDTDPQIISYSITSGMLPTGLTLSLSGLIKGTATVEFTPGEQVRLFLFRVVASDGIVEVPRDFIIRVVNGAYFRVDNTSIRSSTNTISADATYLTSIRWMSESNLGTVRASNYCNLLISTLVEKIPSTVVSFEVDAVNRRLTSTAYAVQENKRGSMYVRFTTSASAALSATIIQFNSTIFYVSKINYVSGTEYLATLTTPLSATLTSLTPTILYSNSTTIIGNATPVLVRNTDNLRQSNIIRIRGATSPPLVGEYFSLKSYGYPNDSTLYRIQSVSKGIDSYAEYLLTLNTPLVQLVKNGTTIAIGSKSLLPPGVVFDPNTALLHGTIPYQDVVSKTYTFTVIGIRTNVDDTLVVRKTFNLTVKGAFEYDLKWATPQYIGQLIAGEVSTLTISAISSRPSSVLEYSITSGALPIGLKLLPSGDIVGKVTLRPTKFNLTTFDVATTSFDDVASYTFEVTAIDKLTNVTSKKTFTLSVKSTPDATVLSDVYVPVLISQPFRDLYANLIKNADIFAPEHIYRIYDPNFGIQQTPNMLLAAGINTYNISVDTVLDTIGKEYANKKFVVTELKTARAKLVTSDNIIYEVLYAEVVDPLVIDSKYVDSNATPSVPLWREKLLSIGESTRTMLPLWMRTVQPGSHNELGYIPAIPICYCKPGTSSIVLSSLVNRLLTATKGKWDNSTSYFVDDTVSYLGQIYRCIVATNNAHPINKSNWQLLFHPRHLSFDATHLTISNLNNQPDGQYLVIGK